MHIIIQVDHTEEEEEVKDLDITDSTMKLHSSIIVKVQMITKKTKNQRKIH